MVRLHDRRKRASRSRQLWRHLRTALRLVLRHPIPSVGVIPLLEDGRIVLVRRADSDRWSLPGGMIDWGETVEQAATRELNEECGLELACVERFVGVYSSPERDPRAHAVNVVIVARVRGSPEVQDRLEVSEIHAFQPEEVPVDHLAHDHGEVFRDYQLGQVVVR